MDINLELLIVFATFWTLSFWTIIKYKTRANLRTFSDWMVDVLSLLQQGFLFPIFQTFIMYHFLDLFFKDFKGTLHLNFVFAFLLQFVLVDYLYYWNHRILHLKKFWFFHRLHHSPLRLDVWVTSRNSFWTSFLIIYLWIHAIFIYLLNDSKPFLLAIAIGNALDLWRHSGLRLPIKLEHILGKIFILPHDHEWHHSNTIHDKNFGANFNIWDRLHGTFYKSELVCEKLGENLSYSFIEKWLLPWRIKS